MVYIRKKMKGNQYTNPWTEEEDNLLVTKKLPNESWKTFRDREGLNRSCAAIRCRAKLRFQLKNDTFDGRKYTLNKEIWNNQTPESCYWGGVIASDGSLVRHGETYSLKLCWQEKDKDLLIQFVDFCEYTGGIRPLNKKSKSHEASINFGTCWLNGLKNNFSITERKTFTLKPPNIKDNYLKNCFIQGFMDGDGSILFADKGGKKDCLSFSVACASKEFTEWFYNEVEKIISHCVYKGRKRRMSKQKNVHRVSVCGLAAAVLIDYYRQFPIPRMSRKWDKPEVLNFIEQKKLKHPEKFLTLEIPPQFR